jgi:hypothetical protein
MSLREQRCLFTTLVADLIWHINSLGYECAINEAYRDPRVAAMNAKTGAGIKNSLHSVGLAVDLNLYIKGKYQTSSEAHRPIGDWWKQRHPLCRWGGDFRRKDGNHYSMEWEGRQ